MIQTYSNQKSSGHSTSRPFFSKTPAIRETASFFSDHRSSVVQRQSETSPLPEEEEKQEEQVLQQKPLETPIQRMCAECEGEQGEKSALQTKLTVGEAGDQYEQEADRVADQVVDHLQTAQAPSVQTKLESARPTITPLVMRQGEGSATVSPHVEQGIQHSRGRGDPLTQPVRRSMEQAFGTDFSGVRIHASGEADALNKSLDARAFTTGQDIFFKSGGYRPEGTDGQRLLAHELTHVIQQGGGEAATPNTLARQAGSGSAGAGPSASMRTAKVWIHSFIPMSRVSDPFGYCYGGDSRVFSNAIHASYRTHQEVEFDVSSGTTTIDWSDTGTTHEVDCTTGSVRASAKASSAGLKNGPVTSISGGRYTINFDGSASNPLAWYACAIDLNLNVTIDTAARTCTVQGQHDGFPAYEVYVTADGGAGVPVYTYDPVTVGEGPTALCGGMDKSAGGTVTF